MKSVNMVLNIFLIVLLIYFLITAFLFFYQRKLLYHPSENNYTGDEIQFEYKEVFIEVDKDIKLKSWFLEKDFKYLLLEDPNNLFTILSIFMVKADNI